VAAQPVAAPEQAGSEGAVAINLPEPDTGNYLLYHVLNDLDLNDGANYEIVGVSLHNYKLMPFQEEMKTWIIRRNSVIREMKRTWAFPLTFDDYCDWHYALKIYRDYQLVKTLKVNLHCGYVTDGYLSYAFDPQVLYALKPYMQPISWSAIHYFQLPSLRKAATAFHRTPDVYLYDELEPYLYDGYFVIGIDNLHWRVSRDSVFFALEDRLAGLLGTEDFHLEPQFTFVSDDFSKISLRFKVYCSETLFRTYKRQVRPHHITAHWRDHFRFVDPDHTNPERRKVQILVIGMTRERYFQLMRSNFN